MSRQGQTTAPQRRSPIKTPPLRTAGQSLREKMLDLLFDRWLYFVLALAVVWLLVLLDWLRLAMRVTWSWKSCLALTSFAAAFSVLAFFRMRGADSRMKNLRLGLEGEVAVGQFLDEYRRERGYKVLHDLQGDGFNVDHVLIGSA